jgi:hypothetical protein
MASNDFKPFAIGVGANVISQVTYAGLAALGPGFSAGTAVSEQLNKVWRQSSVMAAVLGELVEANGGDALDDGDIPTLVAEVAAAIAALGSAGVPDASQTVKGKVELATDAETVTGASTTLATHPSGVAAAIAAALASFSSGLGVGQTWQDKTSVRAINTNYTNSTGQPIAVAITFTGLETQILVDGLTIYRDQAAVSGGTVTGTMFIVPTGSVYRVEDCTLEATNGWSELTA